ncbi:MAG: hypothetical protein QXL51_03070 [Candidatus Aenigmatarchaeota archaeon]
MIAFFILFLTTASFRKLAKRALRVSEPQKGFNLSSISEGKVLYWGHCLIKRLWDKFDFDRFFFNGYHAIQSSEGNLKAEQIIKA